MCTIRSIRETIQDSDVSVLAVSIKVNADVIKNKQLANVQASA